MDLLYWIRSSISEKRLRVNQVRFLYIVCLSSTRQVMTFAHIFEFRQVSFYYYYHMNTYKLIDLRFSPNKAKHHRI
jgi:hypothetical protein